MFFWLIIGKICFLQMLNCCIEHKKKREQLHKGYTGEIDCAPASPFRGPSTSQVSRSLSHEDVIDESDSVSQTGACAMGSDSSIDRRNSGNKKASETRRKSGQKRPSMRVGSSSDSSDEEFFECNNENNTENLADEKDIDTATTENEAEEADDGNEEGTEMECDTEGNDDENQTGSVNESSSTSVAMSGSVGNVSLMSDSVFKESFSHRPEGRLAHFQNLKLVNCDETMYIPITQEPAPMTEDMLEEHAEILAK